MANSDSLYREVCSPKLVIESNSEEQTTAGKCAFSIKGENESGIRCSQGLYENGILHQGTEGRIEIECGDKNKDGQPDFVLIAHNGDVYVNADSGSVTVGARAIHFKASEEIILDAPSIRIGSNEGQTNKIEFHAQNFIPVENGVKKKFELKEALISSSAIAAFKGSLAGGNLKLTA